MPDRIAKKPWKIELIWAKDGPDFGVKRIVSYQTEAARDEAAAEAQRIGYQILRTWRAS